ncbi:hypothetical protein JXO59_14035 [candidate division KSB1 bacterium]|nr:hypothetical protein [candidate division KSB1 bacterium]
MVFTSCTYGQISFSKHTFDRFIYDHAQIDTLATRLLKTQLMDQNPGASNVRCLSLISSESSMKIISHYAILTGRRYEIIDGRFIFPFKRRKRKITDRLEIFSQAIPKVSSVYWPTRINLILFDFPMMEARSVLSQSVQNLRDMAGRLYYDGELREDIAAIAMDELGEGAQVLVVDTRNSFDHVYRFFRQRYGRIRIIPAFSGDVMERDFEIDVTSALGLNRGQVELHIRALENPLVTDREGNSFRYIGHVFIQYTFWMNHDSSRVR